MTQAAEVGSLETLSSMSRPEPSHSGSCCAVPPHDNTHTGPTGSWQCYHKWRRLIDGFSLSGMIRSFYRFPDVITLSSTPSGLGIITLGDSRQLNHFGTSIIEQLGLLTVPAAYISGQPPSSSKACGTEPT